MPHCQGGPTAQNILIYHFPYEEDDARLKTFLSPFGKVLSIRYQHYPGTPDVSTGTRIVRMIREKAIPRNLNIGSIRVKCWYVGQPFECDICRGAHVAKDYPMRGKCRNCRQEGHLAKDCPNPPQAWGVAPAPTLIPPPQPAPSPSHTPTPPEDSSSGADPPVVPVVMAGLPAPVANDPDSMVNVDQAPLFPPLPSLSSASSWGSMADLRDNELSSMEDLPFATAVTVNHQTKTSAKGVTVSTRNEVRNVENTESNGNEGNESNECIESNESMESMESNESNESNEMNSNEIERMDDASQSILNDVVIHRSEEGPPSANSSSGPISASCSGSLVQKRSLADPSSEGAARTKKVAKASSRKARKPSSSTPSLPTTLPGAAKHVGLPSSVSAVPPRNRAH